MDTNELQQLDSKLNQMITEGKALEAFDRFYADDVVMQENLEPAVHGKEKNRKREEEFFGQIVQLHQGRVIDSAVGDDVTFAEMIFDATMKDGNRISIAEVARRKWKDGKVIHERFYYPTTN